MGSGPFPSCVVETTPKQSLVPMDRTQAIRISMALLGDAKVMTAKRGNILLAALTILALALLLRWRAPILRQRAQRRFTGAALDRLLAYLLVDEEDGEWVVIDELLLREKYDD